MRTTVGCALKVRGPKSEAVIGCFTLTYSKTVSPMHCWSDCHGLAATKRTHCHRIRTQSSDKHGCSVFGRRLTAVEAAVKRQIRSESVVPSLLLTSHRKRCTLVSTNRIQSAVKPFSRRRPRVENTRRPRLERKWENTMRT